MRRTEWSDCGRQMKCLRLVWGKDVAAVFAAAAALLTAVAWETEQQMQPQSFTLALSSG